MSKRRAVTSGVIPEKWSYKDMTVVTKSKLDKLLHAPRTTGVGVCRSEFCTCGDGVVFPEKDSWELLLSGHSAKLLFYGKCRTCGVRRVGVEHISATQLSSYSYGIFDS